MPMGRLVDPQDYVGTSIFLASKASHFVTGQTVFVDGGSILVCARAGAAGVLPSKAVLLRDNSHLHKDITQLRPLFLTQWLYRFPASTCR